MEYVKVHSYITYNKRHAKLISNLSELVANEAHVPWVK